jgi:hypothetical protein
MTLQRHTGTHVTPVPPLKPVANVPLSPDAEKKKSEQIETPQAVDTCKTGGGTRD